MALLISLISSPSYRHSHLFRRRDSVDEVSIQQRRLCLLAIERHWFADDTRDDSAHDLVRCRGRHIASGASAGLMPPRARAGCELKISPVALSSRRLMHASRGELPSILSSLRCAPPLRLPHAGEDCHASLITAGSSTTASRFHRYLPEASFSRISPRCQFALGLASGRATLGAPRHIFHACRHSRQLHRVTVPPESTSDCARPISVSA